MLNSVTIADGQRLQILCNIEGKDRNAKIKIITKISNKTEADCEMQPIATQLPKIQKTSMLLPPPTLLAKSLFLNAGNNNLLPAATTNTFKTKQQQQNHLDEITNQVYTELLQGKVDALSSTNRLVAHDNDGGGSTRSDDLGSTKSSSAAGILGRLRRSDARLQPMNKCRDLPMPSAVSSVATTTNTGSDDDGASGGGGDRTKKPLIAKWKAGVKLQVTSKTAENHGNFTQFTVNS